MMNRIKGFFNFLSTCSMYLDAIIFSFAAKEDYEYIPAQRMCLLPSLCGIAAAIQLMIFDFGGAEKEFTDAMLLCMIGGTASINALFHFRRVFAMPHIIWKISYLVYIWVMSVLAFLILFIMVSFIIVGLIAVIVILLISHAALTPMGNPDDTSDTIIFEGERFKAQTIGGKKIFVAKSGRKVQRNSDGTTDKL